MRSRSAIKVWVFLAALSLVLVVGGQRVADRQGLLFGFVLALGLNALVFLYGERRLTLLFPATRLEGQDPWGLLERVERLAARAGLPTPRVFLLHVETPTSFALGLSPRHAAILLSEPVLTLLEGDEIDAVVAHELARIERGDTLAASVASTLASSLGALSGLCDWPFVWFGRLLRREPLRPGSAIFAPLIATLLRFALRRKDFFEADARAAEWLGSPAALARALWKLDAYNATRPFAVALSDAHLFMVNPLCASPLLCHLSLHPSVKHRISRLVGQFPL